MLKLFKHFVCCWYKLLGFIYIASLQYAVVEDRVSKDVVDIKWWMKKILPHEVSQSMICKLEPPEISSIASLSGSKKAQSCSILSHSLDDSLNLVAALLFWQKTVMTSLSLTALSSIAKVEFHLCRHWQSCLASTQVLLLLFLERMLISGVNANRNWFDC